MTTYGLEMSNDLSQRAYKNKATYISGNGSGGYISDQFDGKTNFDSSFIAEEYKSNALYQIISATGQTIPNYNTLSLEEKKLALKGVITSIGSLENETANAVLDGVYLASIDNYVMFSIDGFDKMSVVEKQNAIIDEIDNIKNVLYSEGNAVNVYHHTGLGVVLGLYDKTAE
jgi:hypothetical protein